jgi:hypothetical protein
MYQNKIFQSGNRGENWELVSQVGLNVGESRSFIVSPIDTNVWLAAVFFPGDCGVVRSSDHGKSWKVVLDSTQIGSYTKTLEVDISNPNIIYFATSDRGFFRSVDNGETFQNIGSNKFRNPCDLITQFGHPGSILLADAAYPAIDSSYILKSTDGGFNWQLKYKVGINEIPALSNTVFEPNTFYFTADKLYRSTDSGNSWNIVTAQFQPLWAIDVCREDPTAIIFGKYSGIGYHTTNSGSSYMTINNPSSTVVYSAVIYPQRDYAIAMFHNSLYRLTWFYDVSVGIKTVEKEVIDFNLFQNFPNPFNSSTKISFTLDRSTNVVLELYDIRGVKVQTVLSEFYRPGFQEINVNFSDLNSGVYFYTLKANGQKQVRKLMLIK